MEQMDKRSRSPAVGCPRTPGMVDVVNVCFAVRLKKYGCLSWTEARRGWLARIDQCIQRGPWGGCDCLLTGSMVYSYELDCVMTPEHHVAINGMPSGLNFEFKSMPGSDSGVRQLAGEALSCPCISIILMGLYCNDLAPWWQGSS